MVVAQRMAILRQRITSDNPCGVHYGDPRRCARHEKAFGLLVANTRTRCRVWLSLVRRNLRL